MTEEKNITEKTVSEVNNNKPKESFNNNKNSRRAYFKGQADKKQVEPSEFESKIIKTRRVIRMFRGGRRLRFSVLVVVGDKKGRVGIGIGKAIDVRQGQEKAINNAKKNLVHINLKGNTIPHSVAFKDRASKLILKPAKPGTGIVAGSSMRVVAELAGIKDVVGKLLGTTNQISNAYATVKALSTLKSSRL